MPTYDYQCRSCGTVTEVIHSMLAEGPTTCDRCGGELRRVLFPTGIIFKGSGFYRNDSRAAASGSTGSTPSSDGSSGSEKGSSSEAKPAPAAKDGGAAAGGSGAKASSPGNDS
ncbi:MAG: FmdB family zinc ribbon protein [Chloroflexota bacterium]